ncbi:HPr family phosphocarrier protein [Paraferrimonas sedimenticola]|uniref:Phosphate ABC transporter permease n=1 Tax=Paraferrimonas sedimenticola TaxID=375674 RepID=A0AA37RV72_9GAMM|nr:HPr family phosphocarrier protein [Paraferrimonas sedimenticola]GLP95835.1 phosphate ABC transporter permease [Paraferrimonas sedimenticola]
MSRVSAQVTICNKLGLHARAATKLAQLAQQYDATVTLQQGEKTASAASVLGLLMLESSMGKRIEVIAEGAQAQSALDAVCQLIQARFDESE